MQSAWFKNLKTDEEQSRFMNSLLGAKPVLERLKELLEEKEKEIELSERSLASYDNPNWAYKQAHKNGSLSSLSTIKNLINLDQQKDIH